MGMCRITTGLHPYSTLTRRSNSCKTNIVFVQSAFASSDAFRGAGNKEEPPWWIQNHIILGADDHQQFSGDQQDTLGVDPFGTIQNHAKHQQAIKELGEIGSRTQGKFQYLTVKGFKELKIDPNDIVHLKGFANQVYTSTEECERLETEAMEELKMYSVLAFDGDDPDGDWSNGEYKEPKFTWAVRQYLETTKGHVVAFKIDYEVPSFVKNWEQIIQEYPDRISVVGVDLTWPTMQAAFDLGVRDELARDDMTEYASMEDWQKELIMLGRVAKHVTGGKNVVALGGGFITRAEFKLSMLNGEGASWIIFDVKRQQRKAERGVPEVENPSHLVFCVRAREMGDDVVVENTPGTLARWKVYNGSTITK